MADSTIAQLSELLQNQLTNLTELPVELSAQTYKLKIGTLGAFLGAGYQPVDPDLTTIAGLPQTSGNFLRSNGTAWTSAALTAGDIASGTIATARLGSGTANSTTYLRGDGSWSTPAGGGGGISLTSLSASQPLAYDNTSGAFSLPNATTSASGAMSAADKTTIANLGTTYQPLDSDLTTIAALTQTSGNFLRSNGTSWTSAALVAGDIPVLDAAKITTGTFGTARIPDLSTVYQPINSGLTSIASLTTTAFGRGLLTSVDAAATRTAIGLGTAALTASTDYATAAQGAKADTALQSAAIGSTIQGFDSDLASIAALTTTTFGRSLLTVADAAAGRSALAVGGSSTAKVDVSATKTFASSDLGTYQNCTNSSAIILTIPNDTTLGLSGSDSSEINIARNGTGTIAIAVSGVTVRGGATSLNLPTQWQAATLKRIGANAWTAHGDVE